MSEEKAIDIAAIAGRLSETQKGRLLSLWPSESAMGGYGSDSGCPRLIEKVGITHPIFGAHYRLTPLGLAVRHHLMEKNDVQG